MVGKSNIRDSNENNKFVDNTSGDVCVNTISEVSNTSTNPVPVEFPVAGEPYIYNITIGAGDINIQQSQILPNDTKKILIQHTGTGTINFAFTSGFSDSITIPKGSTYTEQGLDLQSKTIYLKTNKIGKIEILAWV